MKITHIILENVRGFLEQHSVDLSRTINVFIGSNNSGKSTILNSIFLLQRRNVLSVSDITIGKIDGSVRLYFEGVHSRAFSSPNYKSIRFLLKNQLTYFLDINNAQVAEVPQISEQEPHNLIYPYLSKRKAVNYIDTINEANANSVIGNFSNLYSKIDRLATPQFKPGNAEYVEACKNILGFEISTLAKGNGKQAVYFIENFEHIPLTAMGEGVANVLGLVTDLCVAKDRIFLIEEPENDIHPKALKALLNLIIKKSAGNQFFVSTHSNIVMKYLGSAPNAKLFKVTSELKHVYKPNLFVSDIHEIPDNPEDRRLVLEELGYDFFDFDLWKAWLFLEEASAEILIRDYFIKWFTPLLQNKIRTFSANGIASIIPKFEDFNKLFVFLHLEPVYKNKVWVVLDNGEEEKRIIVTLKELYKKTGWNESNFTQFNEHDFEKFYPSSFQQKTEEVLKIKDKQKRREAKKLLLEKIIEWIKSDEKNAKKEFEKSAKAVIEKLKAIETELV